LRNFDIAVFIIKWPDVAYSVDNGKTHKRPHHRLFSQSGQSAKCAIGQALVKVPLKSDEKINYLVLSKLDSEDELTIAAFLVVDFTVRKP